VLAPPSVAPVWRAMAEVDTVLETPFRHGALQLKERWRYARMLRARGYADAYVLPNTLKYALIPWLAGIPRRVGYKGEMRYGLLNVMHHDDEPPRRWCRSTPRWPQAPRDRAARRAAAGMRASAGRLRRCAQSPASRWTPAGGVRARRGIRRRQALAGAAFRQLGRGNLRTADPTAQVALLGSPKDKPKRATRSSPGRQGRHVQPGRRDRLDEAIALIARAARWWRTIRACCTSHRR
jgi:heptosyltransferase-2